MLAYDAAHYERYVSQHGGVVALGGAKGLHAAPTKAQKSILLGEVTDAQLELFRQQEAQRFDDPERAFTYTLRDGTTSTVAPLGKKSAGGKAREHFLLVTERPTSVTLLALVRDAAARLPTGEGSRYDVAELLKESNFIAPGGNDAQLNQVVSGALDRLHYDVDPCVRYDSERKLWIYLHGARAEAEYPDGPPTRGK